MKEARKLALPRFSKIALIIVVIIFLLNYLSSLVLGVSLLNNKFTHKIFYPFEKSSCESRGGSYDYNWSINSYMCFIGGVAIPAKPVIYLYPDRKVQVHVKVNYDPGFSVTYPDYVNGWSVTAEPLGKIIDNNDGKEYSYLYWEGNPDSSANYDLSTGFVVKGEDTASFLQNKLNEIGLTPNEYNEFIVYWYPRMKQNQYNLIHFASKSEYSDKVILDITPKPNSILRVFMVYKPLTELVSVQPQIITNFQRQGFSVVEWGGSELH